MEDKQQEIVMAPGLQTPPKILASSPDDLSDVALPSVYLNGSPEWQQGLLELHAFYSRPQQELHLSSISDEASTFTEYVGHSANSTHTSQPAGSLHPQSPPANAPLTSPPESLCLPSRAALAQPAPISTTEDIECSTNIGPESEHQASNDGGNSNFAASLPTDIDCVRETSDVSNSNLVEVTDGYRLPPIQAPEVHPISLPSLSDLHVDILLQHPIPRVGERAPTYALESIKDRSSHELSTKSDAEPGIVHFSRLGDFLGENPQHSPLATTQTCEAKCKADDIPKSPDENHVSKRESSSLSEEVTSDRAPSTYLMPVPDQIQTATKRTSDFLDNGKHAMNLSSSCTDMTGDLEQESQSSLSQCSSRAPFTKQETEISHEHIKGAENSLPDIKRKVDLCSSEASVSANDLVDGRTISPAIDHCASTDPMVDQSVGSDTSKSKSTHTPLMTNNEPTATIDKPYKCPAGNCSKEYPRLDSLRRHARTHHPEQVLYGDKNNGWYFIGLEDRLDYGESAEDIATKPSARTQKSLIRKPQRKTKPREDSVHNKQLSLQSNFRPPLDISLPLAHRESSGDCSADPKNDDVSNGAHFNISVAASPAVGGAQDDLICLEAPKGETGATEVSNPFMPSTDHTMQADPNVILEDDAVEGASDTETSRVKGFINVSGILEATAPARSEQERKSSAVDDLLRQQQSKESSKTAPSKKRKLQVETNSRTKATGRKSDDTTSTRSSLGVSKRNLISAGPKTTRSLAKQQAERDSKPSAAAKSRHRRGA